MNTRQHSIRRLVLTLGFLLTSTIILLGMSGTASAQWSTNGTNVYYNGGNVGIGTVNPGRALVITADAASGGFMSVIS